jgi:hypothetical protein
LEVGGKLRKNEIISLFKMEITAFGFEKHRKINEELVEAGGVWSG